ncbi:hypothetical protein TcG_09787 [Trypanosoma cruzi]|nr:hypothetical protein TcG_09787 [Trypanosoma cruzi]
MSFLHGHPHTHAHNLPVCPPVCGRPRCEGKCGLSQHVVKSFLGGIAAVMYVLAGRNGMGEERRASNNDPVCGAMRSDYGELVFTLTFQNIFVFFFFGNGKKLWMVCVVDYLHMIHRGNAICG